MSDFVFLGKAVFSTKRSSELKKLKDKKPKVNLEDISCKLFESMLNSPKNLIDYYSSCKSLLPKLTKNEWLVLDFILQRILKRGFIFGVIKLSEFLTGFREGSLIYTHPLGIPERSVINAIKGLKEKSVIFTHSFKRNNPSLFILPTRKGKETYERLKTGELQKKDCDNLNFLIRKKKMSVFNLEFSVKNLHDLVENFAVENRKNYSEVLKNFQESTEKFSVEKEVKTQSESGSENFLPREFPREYIQELPTNKEELVVTTEKKVEAKIPVVVDKINLKKEVEEKLLGMDISKEKADKFIELNGLKNVELCIKEVMKKEKEGKIKTTKTKWLSGVLQKGDYIPSPEVIEKVEIEKVSNNLSKYRDFFKSEHLKVSNWETTLNEFCRGYLSSFKYFKKGLADRTRILIEDYSNLLRNSIDNFQKIRYNSLYLGINEENKDNWFNLVYEKEKSFNDNFLVTLKDLKSKLDYNILEDFFMEYARNNRKISLVEEFLLELKRV